MAYKFLNGWKRFRIIANKGSEGDAPGNEEIFNFTFKFASFVESYEKQSVRREYLNGRKSKKVFYYNMRWEVDYANHLEAADLQNFARIELLEDAGWTLTLIPHIDVKERKCKVQIVDEKRDYGLNPTHRGKKAVTHRGYRIAFENTEPVTSLSFVNMDEYIGNANVKVNPVKIKG
ncbi:MAG TPA: hypothetical protein PKE39_14435 [Ignavibacteria bacterium]|nr:hypothetical protein [Ignavibacteria bacterium]HMR00216.1 hypothetical protein [Ignavibacteria bacterium]